jgi:hypothetical protein
VRSHHSRPLVVRNGSDCRLSPGYSCQVTRHQAPPPAPTPRNSVLAIAEFRALLGARITQSLGASALATVIAFQTYEVTGDPLALGLLGLVEAIPALALMLIGGHLADDATITMLRRSRRRRSPSQPWRSPSVR